MSVQDKRRIEIFNVWVQTIAIIAAGIWALYVFIYKEFYFPESAPINISLNLKLSKKPITDEKGKKQLAVVELIAGAKNPSSRDVVLFLSAFIVYGYKVKKVNRDENKFGNICNKFLSQGYSVSCTMRHTRSNLVDVVATGGLFCDEVLKPNEKIERSIIFHVPIDNYDVLESGLFVPTARKKNNYMVEWNYDRNKKALNYTLYKKCAKDNKERIEGEKIKKMKKDIDFHFANSIKPLSLWQK